MKRKIFVFLLIFIAFMGLIYILGTNVFSTDAGQNSIIQVPLPNDYKNVVSFLLLKDESYIFECLDESSSIYYRYYIDDDKEITIGKIENHVADKGDATLIGDKLYFHVSTVENENYLNNLYCIDISSNSISNFVNDDNSLSGLQTYQFNGNIITLKNRVGENYIATYLDMFDIDSKSWQQLYVNVIDKETYIGSAIFGLYSFGDTLYVLHDERSIGFEDVTTTLKIFDKDMVELQSISMDGLHDFLSRSRIGEIAIINNFIYIRNYSNETILGKIENGAIEVLTQEDNLVLAFDATSPDKPFFYVRLTNKCYILDTKTGDITTINLKLSNDYCLQYMIANDEYVLFTCQAEDKPDKLYYAKKENLGDVYIPCE